MNDSRFGCAVVAHQGKIYVSGGFGSDKNILSSSEVYDPGKDCIADLRRSLNTIILKMFSFKIKFVDKLKKIEK